MVVDIFFPSFVHILDIVAELRPDELPDRSAVTSFDQSQLKHVETQQKEVLPTKAGAVTPFTPFHLMSMQFLYTAFIFSYVTYEENLPNSKELLELATFTVFTCV